MTFCSTIHSIVHTGAKPVLVDCDRDTFNIDPEQIEKRASRRAPRRSSWYTCAAAAARWIRSSRSRSDTVCASSKTARTPSSRPIKGRPAGLMGDAGCFSFYPTKNIATCDGGMVITRDASCISR